MSEYQKKLLAELRKQLHNYMESPWLLDAVAYHEGNGDSIETAVAEIIETLSH